MIDIEPLAGTLGAELRGLDLARPLDPGTLQTLRQALAEHLVLVLRDNPALEAADLLRLASLFGEPDARPFVGPFKLPTAGDPHVFRFAKEAADAALNLGGFWHADVTYRRRPHKAGLLYACEVPSRGGDTLFSNLYLAYESLSPGLRRALDRLEAVHSSAMEYGGEDARFAAVSRDHAPSSEDRRFSNVTYERPEGLEVEETVHPVVRVHPDTGRRHLYVNRGFTTRFQGMTRSESLPLLEYLWQHCTRPEFTCRVRWRAHDVVLWDNRCTHHYALNDYFGERRVMYRVAVHEDEAAAGRAQASWYPS